MVSPFGPVEKHETWKKKPWLATWTDTVRQRRLHHVEVCCLSAGAKFEPLSRPLQAGLRFLHDPLPPSPTDCLAAFLPSSPERLGRRVGFTTFPRLPAQPNTSVAPARLGPISPPVALDDDVTARKTRPTSYDAFWLRPKSSFGRSIITGVQTMVHITLPMRD